MEGGSISHCFHFLEDHCPSIAKEAKDCEERLVNGNFKESIFCAANASALISSKICELNNKASWIRFDQFNRIKQLFNDGLISGNIFQKFKDMDNITNKMRFDESLNLTEEDALKVHKLLFEISAYFYRHYFDKEFEVGGYTGPIMPKGTSSASTELPVKGPLYDYPFKQYNGSYLLNELSKLKNSSEEAVETDEDFSEFKRYLHVDRPIYDEFIEELEKVSDIPSAHLVLLCGSVGDGKSHFLSHLKSKNPELYKKFEIYHDATESNYIHHDALYNLSKQLDQFKDTNLDNSSQKYILAINLGILNNFLESEYAKDFETIKGIIEEADIFDANNLSSNITNENISILTFSDYHLFELLTSYDSDSNPVSSDYISELFKRISQNTENNIFYKAYVMDKIGDFSHPLINNYEMFCDEDVQKIIIEYLIKAFIKFRKITSTRDLLNFIYEIIVPPEIRTMEKIQKKDFINYSLPNLLFNNPDSSDLLKLLNQLDPTLIRNEELDKFIIDLYIKGDLENLLSKYFDFKEMGFFEDYFKDIKDFKEKSFEEQEEITAVLIRLALLYGNNEIKNNFKDETYEKFLKYLCAYNTNKNFNSLLKEIKEAIFMLRGSYKDYICIDRLRTFRVYKYFKVNYKKEKIQNQLIKDDNSLNRFKTEISVNYSVSHSNEKVSLNVDYSLYEYILKLCNGFKPNRNDNENLINFNDFINNLLSLSDDEDLKIKDLRIDKAFSFTFDGIDSFEFKGD